MKLTAYAIKSTATEKYLCQDGKWVANLRKARFFCSYYDAYAAIHSRFGQVKIVTVKMEVN